MSFILTKNDVVGCIKCVYWLQVRLCRTNHAEKWVRFSDQEVCFRQKKINKKNNNNVKQLFLEVHFIGRNNFRQFLLIQKLEELGFRKFGFQRNHYTSLVTSTVRRVVSDSFILKCVSIELYFYRTVRQGFFCTLLRETWTLVLVLHCLSMSIFVVAVTDSSQQETKQRR